MMNDSFVVVAQSMCTLASGVGVYMLWRTFSRERIAVRIVAIGFLLRATAAMVLFWTSWLRLPFAQSLHLGDGYWFFGTDGRDYYMLADMAIHQGIDGVLYPTRIFASPVWVHVLTVGRVLLGRSTAVATITNLALFLGAAIVIARWGNSSHRQGHASLALLGLSVDPSLVLWSTQPLKETFFIFLVALFVFLGNEWTRIDRPLEVARRYALAAGILFTIYLIGGVRWQYGFVLWIVFFLVAAFCSLRRRTGRWTSIGLATALSIAMGPALVASRHGSIESRLRWLFEWPSEFLPLIEEVKSLFEQLSGGTTIGAGPTIEAIPHADMFARALMLLAPRFLVDKLGLATAGGGRGLWLLADVDTLFLLVFAILVGRLVWHNRPLRMVENPMIPFLLVLLLATLPTLYAVNNFGSLIRYRVMVVLPIILLPLALPRRKPGVEKVASDEERAPDDGAG